jgi:hypothetical protein
LLFFGDRINQHEFGAQSERLLQIKQAAMRIDDDGLAVLTELLAIAIFGYRAHGYSRENARTAPGGAVLWLSHGYLVSCIGPDSESTVRNWKVSKNAALKKLAEIAQGSVESQNLFDGREVKRIHTAPRHSLARVLQSFGSGAPSNESD